MTRKEALTELLEEVESLEGSDAKGRGAIDQGEGYDLAIYDVCAILKALIEGEE